MAKDKRQGMLGAPGKKGFLVTRRRRETDGYYKLVGQYHKTLQGLDVLLRKKGENEDGCTKAIQR